MKLQGQLDIRQTMAAKIKGGFLNLKTKEIRIEPGFYHADFKINGDKSYTLILSGREIIKIPIKSDSDLNVPTNGTFSISHNDIKQPFDIEGEMRTDISYSPSTTSVEDCSYTLTENHCQKICDQVSACKIECRDESVTFRGRHEVSFHYRTIKRDLTFQFLKADKLETLATFSGGNTEFDRITDYEGVCR
jgi:hypothetical protein